MELPFSKKKGVSAYTGDINEAWNSVWGNPPSASTGLEGKFEELGVGFISLSPRRDESFSQLYSLMLLLNQKVDVITKKLSDIENKIASIGELYELAKVETDDASDFDVSKDEAKQIILDLFSKNNELDYVEIMETTGLDLELIVSICAELETEKRIECLKR
jgi:uncharacterized protein YecA (UPF0149 family)